VGGMFGIYFAERIPASFAEMMMCDKNRFNTFFHAMLDHGVYLAPSAFEAGFVSEQHDDAVMTATFDAADAAFARLA
ncbi:aspartate aminotransferase family protein, partial [Oxalobacteraceae bacterium OM1]